MKQTLPPVSVRARSGLMSRWDLLAILLVAGLLVFLAEASRNLGAPLEKLAASPISLDPGHLPGYAARTTLRMLAALAPVAAVHLHLRHARRPRAGAPSRCWCRCSTSCSRCRSWASSRSRSCSSCRSFPAGCWRRVRRDLRHLHQPGLEHGVQLLPVAAHRADRTARGRGILPALAPGCASGGSRCRSPCRRSSGT